MQRESKAEFRKTKKQQSRCSRVQITAYCRRAYLVVGTVSDLPVKGIAYWLRTHPLGCVHRLSLLLSPFLSDRHNVACVRNIGWAWAIGQFKKCKINVCNKWGLMRNDPRIWDKEILIIPMNLQSFSEHLRVQS